MKVGACSSDSGVSEICGHNIEGKWPSNLKQHLKMAHPDIHSVIDKKEAEEREKKAKREAEKQKASLKASHQMTLVQSLQSASTYAKTHQRFMAITRKLAIFVGTTNVPNSIALKIFSILLTQGTLFQAEL